VPGKTSADVFWALEEQELFWAETSPARQRPKRPPLGSFTAVATAVAPEPVSRRAGVPVSDGRGV